MQLCELPYPWYFTSGSPTIGPRGSPTSPRTLSGRVGSGSCPCSGIWHGPDQTLSLVGSDRVVSKFHYMDPTRPDKTYPRLRSGLRQSLDRVKFHYMDPRTLSATRPRSDPRKKSVHVETTERTSLYDQTKSAELSETQAVRGSGLVWSGRVRVVESRNDTTRPDQRQNLARTVEW